MMKTSSNNKLLLLVVAIVGLFSLLVGASDPDPLQDFCVGANDTEAGVFVNGRICKDPRTVTVDDFYYAAEFHIRHEETIGPFGSGNTPATVRLFPGLNTLGLSLVREDFAPHGLNPPHTHPRATEVITVLEGEFYVGFMTSTAADGISNNTLYARTLYPGDVFVFPRGLLHFQFNTGNGTAAILSSFNSQNPGVIRFPAALFQLEPPLSVEILARTFLVNEKLAEFLRSRFVEY